MANEYDEQSNFQEDIEAILTTDPVQGDPPGFSGTLTGKINIVLFHIVNRTRWLKDTLAALNITVPNASTTTKGIAEIATKTEAEAATDTTRITPPRRVLDLLRATVAAATETVRGTVLRATQSEVDAGNENTKYITSAALQQKLNETVPSQVGNASESGRGIIEIVDNTEAEGGTDDTRAMTPAKTQRYLRGPNAQTTTTRRGTAELTTKSEAEGGTDNTRMMTSLRTKEFIQHANAQATETRRGTAERASQTEAETGTEDTRMMTPLKTKQAIKAGLVSLINIYTGVYDPSSNISSFGTYHNIATLNNGETFLIGAIGMVPSQVFYTFLEADSNNIRFKNPITSASINVSSNIRMPYWYITIG